MLHFLITCAIIIALVHWAYASGRRRGYSEGKEAGRGLLIARIIKQAEASNKYDYIDVYDDLIR